MDIKGLIDCLSPPGREYTFVSVQRSSRIVVLDILKNEKIREIALEDKGGNLSPKTLLSDSADAGDRLRLDVPGRFRFDVARCESTTARRSDKGTRRFVGDFSLDEAGITGPPVFG